VSIFNLSTCPNDLWHDGCPPSCIRDIVIKKTPFGCVGEPTKPPAVNEAKTCAVETESQDVSAAVAVPAARTGKPPRAPRGRKKAAAASVPEPDKQLDTSPSKAKGEARADASESSIPEAQDVPQTTQRATRARGRGKAAAQAAEPVLSTVRKTRSRTAGAGDAASEDASALVAGTPSGQQQGRPKRQLRSTVRKGAQASPASETGPACSGQVDSSPVSVAGAALHSAEVPADATGAPCDTVVVEAPAKKTGRKRPATDITEEKASSIPSNKAAVKGTAKKASRKRAKASKEEEEEGSKAGDMPGDEEPSAIPADPAAEPPLVDMEVPGAPDSTAEEAVECVGSQATPHAEDNAGEVLPAVSSSGGQKEEGMHVEASPSSPALDVGEAGGQDVPAVVEAGTCDAHVPVQVKVDLERALSSHPISPDSANVPEASPLGDDGDAQAPSPMEEDCPPGVTSHAAEQNAPTTSPAEAGTPCQPDGIGEAEAGPADESGRESPVEQASGAAPPVERVSSSPGDAKCADTPRAASGPVSDAHDPDSGDGSCKDMPSCPAQATDASAEANPAQAGISPEGDSPGLPQALEEPEAEGPAPLVEGVDDMLPRASSPGRNSAHEEPRTSVGAPDTAPEAEDEAPVVETAVPEAQPAVLQERKPGGLGANLVSTVRSFLPFVSKDTVDTAAAAGKAHVKVDLHIPLISIPMQLPTSASADPVRQQAVAGGCSV
jgi:hypothetical protein